MTTYDDHADLLGDDASYIYQQRSAYASGGRNGVYCNRCGATCTWYHTGVRWALLGEDGRLHKCESGGPAVSAMDAALMFDPIPDEPVPGPGSTLKPFEVRRKVGVWQDEAENYNQILTLLGLEEDGDPVDEVRALLRLRDSL